MSYGRLTTVCPLCGEFDSVCVCVTEPDEHLARLQARRDEAEAAQRARDEALRQEGRQQEREAVCASLRRVATLHEREGRSEAAAMFHAAAALFALGEHAKEGT